MRDFVLRKMPCGGVCAEIGVAKGDFTEKIIEINRPSRVYLIDPWFDEPGLEPPQEQRYQDVKQRFASQLASGRAVLMRETSESAASKIPDRSLDWVYVDGDHRYEFVKSDLELYFAKVKPDGYIVCDDYHYAGTWNDGVTRAIDEFIAKGLCRKIYKRRSQFVMRLLR